MSEEEYVRLLESAAVLAASDHARHREAAYRIAVSAWYCAKERFSGLKECVRVILARLGNFPSVDLLVRESAGSTEDGNATSVPLGLWLEVNARKAFNTVRLHAEEVMTLTDFQKQLWDMLSTGESVSISAPTSAGKSFVLQRYIAERFVDQQPCVGVYIVPTRALINQVSTALISAFRRFPEAGVRVATIPLPPEKWETQSLLYVLTQERLQMLTSSAPAIRFDVAIIDEAQEIQASSRGIILQTVVERIARQSDQPQFVFAAPYIENPDMFPAMFSLKGVTALDQEECPVAQNIILINVHPHKDGPLDVSVRLGQTIAPLGKEMSGKKLIGDRETLAFLSWRFGKGSKNLVYAGEPSVCEEVARSIAELVPERATSAEDATQELADFAKFVRSHVHKDYVLAQTILRGVALHYGHMPPLVRQTVERLFEEGKVDFLVCTSTLLQGVNLPAKNIFLLKPTKGRGKPVVGTDFRNLTGRAGRLGKDFQGNVFVINLQKWGEDPFEAPSRSQVEPALVRTVVTYGSELLEFANNKEHASGEATAVDHGIENAYVKLFNDFRKGRLEGTLERFADRIPVGFKEDLLIVMEETASSITVPEEILERNGSISAYRQQEMLDYLLSKVPQDPPRYIPRHPQHEEAYESLLQLFCRIKVHFTKETNKMYAHFAALALDWMHGQPLPRLIDEAHQRAVEWRPSKPPTVAATIRKVMGDIEDVIRFRYVKFTRCYVDLLSHVLEISEMSSYARSIPALPLYLELGASSETMVSLIGIGLSRTTAGMLARHAPGTDMDISQVWNWFVETDFRSLSLPVICRREVEQLRARSAG